MTRHMRRSPRISDQSRLPLALWPLMSGASFRYDVRYPTGDCAIAAATLLMTPVDSTGDDLGTLRLRPVERPVIAWGKGVDARPLSRC